MHDTIVFVPFSQMHLQVSKQWLNATTYIKQMNQTDWNVDYAIPLEDILVDN